MEKITDTTIEELTKMLIKEHQKDQQYYVLTKEELIRFSIKLINLIKKYEG